MKIIQLIFDSDAVNGCLSALFGTMKLKLCHQFH